MHLDCEARASFNSANFRGSLCATHIAAKVIGFNVGNWAVVRWYTRAGLRLIRRANPDILEERVGSDRGRGENKLGEVFHFGRVEIEVERGE